MKQQPTRDEVLQQALHTLSNGTRLIQDVQTSLEELDRLTREEMSRRLGAGPDERSSEGKG